MADPCCDAVVGGLVYISMGDKRYEATGDVTVQPADRSREAGVSTGGRMWVTEAASLRRATITFLNLCDADPQELFDARCHVDITIVEKSRGFRHLFTQASIVGTVEVNLSNGEFGGIEIATDKYVKKNVGGGSSTGLAT